MKQREYEYMTSIDSVKLILPPEKAYRLPHTTAQKTEAQRSQTAFQLSELGF